MALIIATYYFQLLLGHFLIETVFFRLLGENLIQEWKLAYYNNTYDCWFQ